MRVLFLNYEYPPLGGGAGNATYYLLKEFSQISDLQVDLVTSSIDKSHIEKISDNITIHYLDIHKNGDMHFQSIKDLLLYSWKAFWYAKKLSKQKDFHLCHAFFGIPCGYLAMKLDLPYIVSLRGSDVPYYNNRFRLLDKFVFRFISKKVWKKSQAVIALSHDLIKLSKKTSAKQEISVVYNGINIHEFYPDSNILEKENSFNILFIGRLIERKGFIYLLQAFQEIAKINKNVRLIVAGDGPLKTFFEDQAKQLSLRDKIDFLGVVKHEQINKIYQKSHVFVLPSLNEALGNVTQEALASGLPIITTRTGAAELMDENGFIIKKESSEDIQNSIQKLIDNPDLRKKMSIKSRELAEKMSWKNVAQKYFEIYKNTSVEPNKKESKGRIKMFLKVLVSLGFISWLIYKVDWPIVLSYFRQMDIWWMLAFAIIYALGIVISSYKWKILADFKKINVKFSSLVKIYLTGAFINNFFPSIIGGDAYRSYMLGKATNKKYVEATSTVLVDRLSGFLGVMVIILACSLLSLDVVLKNPILIITNIIIIASFGFEFFIMILRLLPIWNYVKRFIPQNILNLIKEISSYREYRILAKSLLWGVIFNFIGIGIATWMLFQDLHIAISFTHFLLAISIISIVSSIPISIGNIGIKEWAYITFFAIFGVNGEAAISIAIFGRFLQMLVTFFAIPYYLKEKDDDLKIKTT